jgi:hypothetical protein
MTQDGQRRTRKSLLDNLLWAAALGLVLAVGYVLSYPIALRLGPPEWISHTPGYGPVEWLIDETPLRRPLLLWSEVCGSEMRASIGSTARGITRGIAPPGEPP